MKNILYGVDLLKKGFMMIIEYEKQVYTAILGKVIGVYMGRPFEGWKKEKIQGKWGMIRRYVNEDQKVPLVVADDDISGTLTFIKALEDSGAYENTPDDFFGKTWLNYLLPMRSVLWWGGACQSTEHTAYLRLKQGYASPESGSMKLNGKEVSEQIGAQIFIDCFGMVAPGDPALAAKLAEKSARVSHDGEAVYAAKVVAAMVSLAFVEKNMEKLLNKAVKVIPTDSLIARIHKDVRQWAKQYADWNDTFAEIEKEYGYSRYGGNCHVVPNHAVMVMAWSYAQNDFFKAMSIVNTAGWDTDCNAANVGTVSALVAGLEHINDTYDFHTPFGDRLIIPTADGTNAVSDVLEQALQIARIGRRIMKLSPLTAPKHGAKYHFEMPEAVQGFMAVEKSAETRGNAAVRNVPAPDGFDGSRCLEYTFRSGPGNRSAVETPLTGLSEFKTNYAMPFTPEIYSGSTLTMKGRMEQNNGSFRMYIRTLDQTIVYSEAAEADPDGNFVLVWKPEFPGIAAAFGFEHDSQNLQTGKILIDSISITGTAHFETDSGKEFTGWLNSMDSIRKDGFSTDTNPELRYFISNGNPDVLVTGNRTWGDIRIQTTFQIHSADRTGIIFNYQGLNRWNGLIFTKEKLQLIHNFYGENIIAEIPFAYQENQPMELEIRKRGAAISVKLDGREILSGKEPELICGGAGFFAEFGLSGFSKFTVDASIVNPSTAILD